MSTPPEQSNALTDSLFEDLKETPVAALGPATKKVGHFTPEDDENHRRGIKSKNRETVAQIKRFFMWFMLAVVCVASVVLIFGFICLIWLYLRHVIWGDQIADPSMLQQIIVGVLWTGVVAMATLWTEGVLKGEDR